MQKSRFAGALAAVAAMVVLAACSPSSQSEPTATVSISAKPEVTEVALPPAPKDPRPEVIWPLTGLDATKASKQDLARPALSIKIENTDAARPQENLDKADVVFEEYVEYGISRFIAVYQSTYPQSVGPIRSMRPMDRHIMGSLDGPLVFSGAQPRFIRDTANSGQVMVTQDLGDYGFYRSSGRAAPHNLHGYPEDFAEQSGGAKAPEQQWKIAYPAAQATAQQQGKKTTLIDITMSSLAQPEWRWDASKKTWMRYEAGTPHVTSAGTQLSASNVVMLWVTVRYTSGSARSSVPETLVSGESGTGFVATGGKVLPIEWSKKGQYEPFVLTTKKGQPVALAPGKTWFELVPNKGVSNSTSITFS